MLSAPRRKQPAKRVIERSLQGDVNDAAEEYGSDHFDHELQLHREVGSKQQAMKDD